MPLSLREHQHAGYVSTVNPTLTVADLNSLCESPWGLDDYSPVRDRNYLLLDTVGAVDQATGEQLTRIARRLRGLPCPVIAVGGKAPLELHPGLDVIVDTLQQATPLLRNIDQHPLAAMTLVQLLRHNEETTPSQGLFAESLAYASLQGGAEFARVIKTSPAPTHVAEETGNAVLVARAGEELHITLNRPHARNAYSAAMRDGLYEALQLLKMDSSLSGAVIRGAGSCFCIGGDLGEFGAVGDTATAHAIRATRSVAHALLATSTRLEFHLHSACIGAGIELPAFAARVAADKTAFMQLPEIRLGLLPGAGGTVSIARRIGRHRTAYMALSARRISATTALQWGLVDEIV